MPIVISKRGVLGSPYSLSSSVLVLGNCQHNLRRFFNIDFTSFAYFAMQLGVPCSVSPNTQVGSVIEPFITFFH